MSLYIMSLLLITTGGTIDSHRDTKQQMIAPLRHTIVPETMQQCWLEYDEHIALCAKDARDMDANDLDRLLGLIQTTTHDRILITHGYQTMADTMKWIARQERMVEQVKRVIFIDSLIPLSEADSDGPEQLIAGYHHLQSLPSWPAISALWEKQPIHADELQQLQYQGVVSSEWCV